MSRRDGQIIRRGESKWLVRWYDAASGKYPSKTVHGTKHDAEKVLRGILRSRDLGDYVEPNTRTPNDQLDHFLKSSANSVSGRTLADMRSILDRHVRPAI